MILSTHFTLAATGKMRRKSVEILMILLRSSASIMNRKHYAGKYRFPADKGIGSPAISGLLSNVSVAIYIPEVKRVDIPSKPLSF